MSISSALLIFPIEYNTSEIAETNIISHCDIATRLCLSLVTKTAWKILNNEHFKLLFCERYAKMCGSPNLFKNLIYFHPNICWKVACYALSHPQFYPRSPIFFEDPSKVLPSICEVSAQRYKEICGEEDQDPDSPINQAWIAYQEAEARLNTWVNSYGEAFQEMVTPYQQETGQRGLLGQAAMQAITLTFRLPRNQRSPQRFEEILKDAARQFNIMTIDEDIHQSIFRCFEKVRDNEMNEAESEFKMLGRRFWRLESERQERETLPKVIESDIQVLNKEGRESLQFQWKLLHYNALVEEMIFARTVECKNFNDVDPLLELHILTNTFTNLQKRDVPVPFHSREFLSLPELLNSCACREAMLLDFQMRVTSKRGDAAWHESLIDNIREHLRIFEKVIEKQRQGFIDLFEFFSKSLQHPCQTSDPSWNELEERVIWEQKMNIFLNSLLPEGYLNNPERRQTIFEVDKLNTETIPLLWIDEVVTDMDRLSNLE